MTNSITYTHGADLRERERREKERERERKERERERKEREERGRRDREVRPTATQWIEVIDDDDCHPLPPLQQHSKEI